MLARNDPSNCVQSAKRAEILLARERVPEIDARPLRELHGTNIHRIESGKRALSPPNIIFQVFLLFCFDFQRIPCTTEQTTNCSTAGKPLEIKGKQPKNLKSHVLRRKSSLTGLDSMDISPRQLPEWSGIEFRHSRAGKQDS